MEHREKNKRRKAALWIAAVSVWVAAVAFGASLPAAPLAFDAAILSAIHNTVVQPWLTPVFRFITFTGDPLFYVLAVIPLVLWLLWRGKRREALLVAGVVLAAWGLNEGLKAAFQRVRPQEWMLITQGGASYPSGHSMVGMAFYSTVASLVKLFRRKWGLFLHVYAFLPGLSRLYLGVHWPTDVAFGFALGWSIYFVAKELYGGRKTAGKEVVL